MKEQYKTPEKNPNETEINNLPDQEFKATVKTNAQWPWEKNREKHSENFNKELENLKKNQPELKNTVIEMKNMLEGINSRSGDTEECISNLEDGRVE